MMSMWLVLAVVPWIAVAVITELACRRLDLANPLAREFAGTVMGGLMGGAMGFAAMCLSFCCLAGPILLPFVIFSHRLGLPNVYTDGGVQDVDAMFRLSVGGNALIGAYLGYFITLPSALNAWRREEPPRSKLRRTVQLIVLLIPIVLAIAVLQARFHPFESDLRRAYRLCRDCGALNTEIDRAIDDVRKGDPGVWDRPMCGPIEGSSDITAEAECFSAIMAASKNP